MRIGKYDFDHFGKWYLCENGKGTRVGDMLAAVLDHIEVLQAKFANDLKLIEADRQALKARAEKAEADFLACAEAAGVVYASDGRASHPGPVDDVVAAIKSAAIRAEDAEAERDDLRAQLADREQKCATAVRDLVRGNADTRARFEREATLQFLQRVDFVEETGGVQVMRYESPRECYAKAKQAADVVLGPAPAPVNGDASDNLTISDVMRMIAGGGKVSDVGEAHVGPAKKMLERVAAALNQPIEKDAPPLKVHTCEVLKDDAGMVSPTAPPQFKVGDPIIHCSGRRGKIVGIHDDAIDKACIKWSDGTSTMWERLSSFRPAPPEEPWTPKKGDTVRFRFEWQVAQDVPDHVGQVLTQSERGNVCWAKPSDLELVRRAEDAK